MRANIRARSKLIWIGKRSRIVRRQAFFLKHPFMGKTGKYPYPKIDYRRDHPGMLHYFYKKLTRGFWPDVKPKKRSTALRKARRV